MELRSKCFCLIIIILLLVQGRAALAQNRVFGKIVDASTAVPLPYVNIFFVNTTFGTTSTAEGTYSIAGFKPGKYDLIFSMVGYKRQQQSVQFEERNQVQIDIKLEPELIQLNEVTVMEDTLGWKRNFESFKTYFLGRSDYSKKAVIQNPKDIHVYFDRQSSTLVAHAKKPIVILNEATGYKVRYYLDLFEFHFRSGQLFLYGFPEFEKLVPRNSREEKRWERERASVYTGSLMQFIRSWKSNMLVHDGYKVARVYKIKNTSRPTDEYLNSKINELTKRNAVLGNQGDSLRYFRKLKSKPVEVDSVAKEILNGSELLDTTKELIQYKGALEVEYKQKEELSYARFSGRDFTVKQKSRINILGTLKLYENGYYEDVRNIILEKYWSWVENVSTLLPLDYRPELK